MWIPGIIVAPLLVVCGVLLFIFRTAAADLFSLSREGGSRGSLLAIPAIGLILIGLAWLTVSLFLKPS